MKRREFIAMLGAAAAWPVAARAQDRAVSVIGYLSGEPGSGVPAAFRQGLAELGFVEGRNVEILYRSAEGHYDRLPELAADLVARRVALIATGQHFPALAARKATTTIPIVFAFGADPVALGLVASLNRPGGNITGTSFVASELIRKRFELLHEIVPAVTTIGLLVNPTTPHVQALIREGEDAARILGVHLVILNATNATEIELVIGGDPLFTTRGPQLVELAGRHRVVTIYSNRGAVQAGGLISYGASIGETTRIAGTYAGRILKGEKPADLPVQQATRVELIINLKAAKALGITFPLTLLGRADEVIE
jgi:putative ABC transport system substrate-binding protein